MFCQKCGEKLKEDEKHDCENNNDKSVNKKNKTPFIITVVAAIGLLLESLFDLFFSEFFLNRAEIVDIVDVESIGDMITVMAVIGIFMAIFLGAFIYFAREKSYYYIGILIFALVALFASSAAFAPIVLLVGAIMGLSAKNK